MVKFSRKNGDEKGIMTNSDLCSKNLRTTPVVKKTTFNQGERESAE